jgi:hypothetical protein
MRIGGDTLEKTSGGHLKPAQRSFLHPISHRRNQQVLAKTCRRLGLVERPPAPLQLCDIERLESGDFAYQLFCSRSDNVRLIDCPPLAQADTYIALLAAESQS